MSVVIVTRCFVTRSLIRDSGAEVVTGPGWETQSRGTETASVNQENVNFEINTWTLRFTSSWIWVKKESEPVLMFSLHDDVMVMLVRPWPDVMMTVSPFRHLVVTNKSYKNPQLIRSDSVQNSFFLPPGRSCWGWFIAMSQTVRVEIDWKKSENYFKNYLQLIEDDTRS